MENTTFLNLKKPGTGDTASIGDINDNMDTIDERVKGLTDGFAVNEEGDTATAAIASGQYVMWKGVLTKAATAIAIGDSLNSTKLPAVQLGTIIKTLEGRFSSGALKIANGGTGMTEVQTATYSGKGINLYCYKFGKVVFIRTDSSLTSAVDSGATILTIGAAFRPTSKINIIMHDASGEAYYSITTDGAFYPRSHSVAKDTTIYGSACYIQA